MRRALVLSTLVVGALTNACNDPVGSGLGRAEGLVQDVPPTGPVVTGSLAGNVNVSLSADGTQWTDLGSPNGITIPLQVAGTTTVHGEQDAPTGSYNRARLVFQGVTARLNSGSTVGGVVFTSDVTITLGGSDQRVELIVPVPAFTVEADPATQRTILFELRSSLWLTAAILQTRLVEDAALQGAVLASTRLDPR